MEPFWLKRQRQRHRFWVDCWLRAIASVCLCSICACPCLLRSSSCRNGPKSLAAACAVKRSGPKAGKYRLVCAYHAKCDARTFIGKSTCRGCGKEKEMQKDSYVDEWELTPERVRSDLRIGYAPCERSERGSPDPRSGTAAAGPSKGGGQRSASRSWTPKCSRKRR